VVADVDDAGNLYLAWTDQQNVTLAVSSDKAASWRFLTVTSGNGTRVLPWVAAGDDGRAGVVWYETNETGRSDTMTNASWDVMAAVTTDAFADNVTFHKSVVAPAVHAGSIRTTGTSGNADRDLGDYMSCDVDAMGRLIMTFGNDGDDGVGQYNSKVMVARQTGGPYLKEGVGPVARFTHSLEGMKVFVDGRQSFDMNGRGITAFRWDWGDGTNTTEKNDTAASHTYRKAGRYELRLQVTNPDNMTGSASVMLDVQAAGAEIDSTLLGGLGAVAAVAAVVALWWKYGKGKLRFPGKKGETAN
jgi:PKD repeat protein